MDTYTSVGEWVALLIVRGSKQFPIFGARFDRCEEISGRDGRFGSWPVLLLKWLWAGWVCFGSIFREKYCVFCFLFFYVVSIDFGCRWLKFLSSFAI